MKQIYGIGAAGLVSALLATAIATEAQPLPAYRQPIKKPRGPVLDTTRETKREKRRRMKLSTPTSQP